MAGERYRRRTLGSRRRSNGLRTYHSGTGFAAAGVGDARAAATAARSPHAIALPGQSPFAPGRWVHAIAAGRKDAIAEGVARELEAYGEAHDPGVARLLGRVAGRKWSHDPVGAIDAAGFTIRSLQGGSSALVGLTDRVSRTVWLRRGLSTAAQKLTLAHELAHVLRMDERNCDTFATEFTGEAKR